MVGDQRNPELAGIGADTLVVLGVLAILVGMLARATVVGPAIGVVVLLGVGVLFSIHLGRRDLALGFLIAGALAARVAVIGVDELFGIFPKVDARGYHASAAALADSWWTGSDWGGFHSYKNGIYKAFIAPFYFLFGASPVLARVVNATLSLVAVYAVYRIGREVFDQRAGLFAGAAFAFLPSIVRIHGEHLREVLIIVLITHLLYLIVSRRLLETWGILTGLPAAGLLFFLRRGTFVVFLVPLVLLLAHRFVYGQRSWRDLGDRATAIKRTAGVAGGLAACAGLAAWIIGPSELLYLISGKGYISRLSGLGPETIQGLRRPWVRGGSAYLTDYTFNDWLAALVFVPLGALYFLFTPFPWQLHNGLAVVAGLENYLIFYPLTVLAILQLGRESFPSKGVPLAAFFLAAAIVYGLVEGNIGTALRHRAQFTWILFIFAGPALARKYDEHVWWRRSGDVEEPTSTPDELEDRPTIGGAGG